MPEVSTRGHQMPHCLQKDKYGLLVWRLFRVSFTGTGSQLSWLPPGLAGEPLSHLVLLRGEYEMSKAEKQNLRYCDYYWCMSLKDFTEWVEADDGFEPAMSFADIP